MPSIFNPGSRHDATVALATAGALAALIACISLPGGSEAPPPTKPGAANC